MLPNWKNKLETHNHSPQKVSPSGAAPPIVTAAGGAWSLGGFSADLIAAGAESDPFDLHWVDVSNMSANDDYEVVIYYGPSDIECARAAFSRSGVQTSSVQVPLHTYILPAGSRVRAKIMSAGGGSSAHLKLFYHNY